MGTVYTKSVYNVSVTVKEAEIQCNRNVVYTFGITFLLQ